MKRITIILTMFIIVLLLGACGKKNTEIDTQTEHGTEITSGTEGEKEIEVESETKNDKVENDTEINTENNDVKDNSESDTSSGEKLENTNTNKDPVVNNGDSQQTSEVETHSHTYTDVITKEATCSENGIKTYSCSCGYSYTEEIGKTNHIESEWQVVSEPTQTEDGVEQTVCTKCNVQMAKKMKPCKQVYDNMSEYWSYYEEVLVLVNELRAEVGLAPVVLDYDLCTAATKRAVEMDYAEWFGHDRPDGRDCFTVIADYGISGSGFGENIASGFYSPEEVVEIWKSSQGHYEVMTEARFTKIGVGYCNEWEWHEWDLKRLWVLMCSD